MRVPVRKSSKLPVAVDPLMTAAKLASLVTSVERLKKQRPALAAEVKRLSELGDFSENTEYQLAKGKLRGLNSRLEQVQYQIDHAVTIVSTTTERVAVGHRVTVETEGKSRSFVILGSSETDPARGIISYTSPLGAALLGGRVNDEVVVPLAEKQIKYKIIKIEAL